MWRLSCDLFALTWGRALWENNHLSLTKVTACHRRLVETSWEPLVYGPFLMILISINYYLKKKKMIYTKFTILTQIVGNRFLLKRQHIYFILFSEAECFFGGF